MYIYIYMYIHSVTIYSNVQTLFGKITATLTIVEQLFENGRITGGKRGYPNDGL